MKILNQKKNYNELNKRLARYLVVIENIFDDIAKKAANAAELVKYEGGVEFLFSDYPELKNTLENIMSDYVNSISKIVYSGTSDEWKRSNLLQDLLVKEVFKSYKAQINEKKEKIYFKTNSDALKAFQERREKGMNLSKKLWNQAEELKSELECCISTAIEKGISAITLSKRVSKYLNDFPSLQKDYKQKYGKATSIKNCQYASARLARTEINIAYRKAENLRWNQFDFILGYEVKLSGSHPAADICDDLKGVYPKDFVFVGWHPNCMCYVVPIIMTDEEYFEEINRREAIKEPNEKFKEWAKSNRKKIIDKIKGGKNIPYFVQDNMKYFGIK